MLVRTLYTPWLPASPLSREVCLYWRRSTPGNGVLNFSRQAKDIVWALCPVTSGSEMWVFCTCNLKSLSVWVPVPGLESTVTISALVSAFRETPQVWSPCVQQDVTLSSIFTNAQRFFWFCFPFYCMFMGVFPTYMSMYHTCVVTREPRKGTGLPETGVTAGGEPSCACREMNPGPLKSTQCSQLLSYFSSSSRELYFF